MKRCNVPQWYIDSCLRIEYMFPKAHAAAYVISAVRTAYFKLYYPIEYYATYFSVRAADFDVELFCQGYDAILKMLARSKRKASKRRPKEKNMISILEMGLEMTARGFKFKPVDLYRSEATRFIIDGDCLFRRSRLFPALAMNAARNIAASREDGEFLSIEDFQQRSKASKTIVEMLNTLGLFPRLAGDPISCRCSDRTRQLRLVLQCELRRSCRDLQKYAIIVTGRYEIFIGRAGRGGGRCSGSPPR